MVIWVPFSQSMYTFSFFINPLNKGNSKVIGIVIITIPITNVISKPIMNFTENKNADTREID